MKKSSSLLASAAGQTLVEYGMILVLVAAVLYILFAGVGAKTNEPLENVSNAVGQQQEP